MLHEAGATTHAAPFAARFRSPFSRNTQFLSPDRKQTIFQIRLHQVGLVHAAVDPSKANGEQIKRMQFELYVHRIEIEGSSVLGFS